MSKTRLGGDAIGESLPCPGLHFHVAVKGNLKSLQQLFSLSIRRGKSELDFSTFLGFCELFETGAHFRERDFLMVDSRPDAILVRSELFKFGSKEGGLDVLRFAVENEKVGDIIRLDLQQASTPSSSFENETRKGPPDLSNHARLRLFLAS